jgi:5-methylcytosine-specific restriction endonuclease McrA
VEKQMLRRIIFVMFVNLHAGKMLKFLLVKLMEIKSKYEVDKEQRKLYDRKKYLADKEGIKTQVKRRSQLPIKKFHKYVYDAKRRGHDFKLKEEEFFKLIKENCNYCGKTDNPNGIDRFNNKEPYTIENCVPCCGRCNKRKWTMNGNEFIIMCNEVAFYRPCVPETSTSPYPPS